MCGIVGYIGPRSAAEVLLEGLRKLEYRGYDSAGIAIHAGGEPQIFRTKGKIAELVGVLPEPVPDSRCGIGHTRWATHGRPSTVNAHPHRSGEVIVVHNGIIENHLSLRAELERDHDRVFSSETDTEIFAHLIDLELQRDPDMPLLDAVRRAIDSVEGSYALGVVHAARPDRLVCARSGSPLVLGVGDRERFCASDIPAILAYTRDIVFLEDGDLAELSADGMTVIDGAGKSVERPQKRVMWDPLMAEKGGYPHFMLKEIHEQPRAITDTLAGRINMEEGKVHLDEPFLDDARVRALKRIVVVSCGTSYHAGVASCYEFEQVLGIPATAEYASEFRYRNPVLGADDLVIAISQSGETADTLAAVELAKAKGAFVLSVCNVMESSLARTSDYVLYTHAGPEISVASTKAFVTQLISMQLLLLRLAGIREAVTPHEVRAWLQELSHLPAVAQTVLDQEDAIQQLAKRYAYSEHMLYLGRGVHYPLAMEGALKLKEISYIHAEAYAAGEMKHGPIALIDHKMPTFAIVHQSGVREKVMANIQEIRARDGKVIAIVAPDDEELIGLCDAAIEVPSVGARVDPVLISIPLQLFAYYVAVHRGTDVDQPRNLAKSVTVE